MHRPVLVDPRFAPKDHGPGGLFLGATTAAPDTNHGREAKDGREAEVPDQVGMQDHEFTQEPAPRSTLAPARRPTARAGRR